jgi:hypothetical protein
VYSYDELTALGGIDQVPELSPLLAKVVSAKTNLDKAIVREEASRKLGPSERAQNNHSNPLYDGSRSANTWRQRRTVAVENLEDATVAHQHAQEDFQAAKSSAFDRIVPVLRAEHQARLGPLREALEQVVRSCASLTETEALAGSYALSSGARCKNALQVELGEQVSGSAQHFLGVLGRLS